MNVEKLSGMEDVVFAIYNYDAPDVCFCGQFQTEGEAVKQASILAELHRGCAFVVQRETAQGVATVRAGSERFAHSAAKTTPVERQRFWKRWTAVERCIASIGGAN